MKLNVNWKKIDKLKNKLKVDNVKFENLQLNLKNLKVHKNSPTRAKNQVHLSQIDTQLSKALINRKI